MIDMRPVLNQESQTDIVGLVALNSPSHKIGMIDTLDSNLGVAENCPCAGSKPAVAAQLVSGGSHRFGDAHCNHVAGNISPNT